MRTLAVSMAAVCLCSCGTAGVSPQRVLTEANQKPSTAALTAAKGDGAIGSVTITAIPPLQDQSYGGGQQSTYGAFLVRRLRGNTENPAGPTLTLGTEDCGYTICSVLTFNAKAGESRFAVLFTEDATPNSPPLAYGVARAHVQPGANTAISLSLSGIPAAYSLGGTFAGNVATLTFATTDAQFSHCSPNDYYNYGCVFIETLSGTSPYLISLTDNDPTGQSGLSVNGEPPVKTVVLNQDSATIELIVRPAATISQAWVTASGVFSTAAFPGETISLSPGATENPNGLGFSCYDGNCSTQPYTVTP
jgi:hypothetical protein